MDKLKDMQDLRRRFCWATGTLLRTKDMDKHLQEHGWLEGSNICRCYSDAAWRKYSSKWYVFTNRSEWNMELRFGRYAE